LRGLLKLNPNGRRRVEAVVAHALHFPLMLVVYGYQLIVRSVAQSVSVNTDGVEWPYRFCWLVEMNKGENQIHSGFLGARIASPRLVGADSHVRV